MFYEKKARKKRTSVSIDGKEEMADARH